MQVPGAKTVSTGELKALLQRSERPVLMGALTVKHQTIPGAVWWSCAGMAYTDSRKDEWLQIKFENKLMLATVGTTTKPIVFFCANAQCWLSYNAWLRAATCSSLEPCQ